MRLPRRDLKSGVAFCAILLAAGCAGPFDMDLRSVGNGFDTTDAVQQITAPRPEPDNRGVISYPSYQVAIARRGDTVSDVAGRVGVPAAELAAFNGMRDGVPLRSGEILALPGRVAEPSPATGSIGSGPILPAGQVDVTTLAGQAIERSGPSTAAPRVIPGAQTGEEPVRHQVEPGETAFSIARLYGVTPRALADWNSLGADMNVRSGQYLLIPVALDPPPAATPVPPGRGTDVPAPPSAATPLPLENARPEATPAPESPQMADDRTGASDTSRLLMPVSGSIIRAYDKGKNDGIGISAAAGARVNAADGGTVAAITLDTNQVPILVLRHEGNLLTVYAGVDNIAVKKGDSVSRGQKVAEVREGSPSFVHFEVREGFDSVDPMPFLN